jgi:hypothetical protein
MVFFKRLTQGAVAGWAAYSGFNYYTDPYGEYENGNFLSQINIHSCSSIEIVRQTTKSTK